MSTNRRNLILGATLGAVVPSLVRAESLVDIPGDPLTKHGLSAAEQWATDEFMERPGARLVFASGHQHRWMTWNTSRLHGAGPQKDYAVAIEVSVTDGKGRRFIHSIPIDAVGIEKVAEQRRQEMMKRWRLF